MENHKEISKNTHKLNELFKKSPVLTTSEIASSLEMSWNTAEKLMLELALAGEVQRIKKAGVNLWVAIRK